VRLHPRRLGVLQGHGVQRSLSDSSRSTGALPPNRSLHQLHPSQLHRLQTSASAARRHQQILQQHRSRPTRRTRSSSANRTRPGNPYMSTRMAYLNLMDPCRTMPVPGCFSYPTEPPPPYTDFELPPYSGNDPAPFYRSRASPAPSL
jgi:hypothetical protein